MAKYNHTRKGLMIGEIVKERGEWVDFKFSEDQTIKYSNGNERVEKGQVMTFRKSFLIKEKTKLKKYSVLVYPSSIQFEVMAENKTEAQQKAIDIYTPNSMDVYKTVVEK